MKLVMGVLCYSRPIHTALTIAYACVNKSATTDLHFFYGIPESGVHKSAALLGMLLDLEEAGCGTMHFLPEDAQRNTGGNVDNLFHTLGGLKGYDAYFKIDDDVIIGHGTDLELASLLLSEKLQTSRVYILAAQVVREHMHGPRPFCWDTRVNGRTIVSRENGQSPMETYTVMSYSMLPHLQRQGFSTSCDNRIGTYAPFSHKLANSGAKAGIVLTPSIVMQHIGLTCTTGDCAPGVSRSWAPARSWMPSGKVIEVPLFDFQAWERSHSTGLQKEVALGFIDGLISAHGNPVALQIIRKNLELYQPGVDDVPLPEGKPVESCEVIRKRRRNQFNVLEFLRVNKLK